MIICLVFVLMLSIYYSIGFVQAEPCIHSDTKTMGKCHFRGICGNNKGWTSNPTVQEATLGFRNLDFRVYISDMKIKSALLGLFFLCSSVHADCDAPALQFPVRSEAIFGFKVAKLSGTEDDPKPGKSDSLVKFGDYTVLFSPLSPGKKPVPVKFSNEEIKKKLLANFKSGPNYLEKEKQKFTITDIQGFDLNGDSKPDVFLFGVSPGANVYTGVVGIIDSAWVTLVEPMCF